MSCYKEFYYTVDNEQFRYKFIAEVHATPEEIAMAAAYSRYDHPVTRVRADEYEFKILNWPDKFNIYDEHLTYVGEAVINPISDSLILFDIQHVEFNGPLEMEAA